jgi:hypothetical protein
LVVASCPKLLEFILYLIDVSLAPVFHKSSKTETPDELVVTMLYYVAELVLVFLHVLVRIYTTHRCTSAVPASFTDFGTSIPANRGLRGGVTVYRVPSGGNCYLKVGRQYHAVLS